MKLGNIRQLDFVFLFFFFSAFFWPTFYPLAAIKTENWPSSVL